MEYIITEKQLKLILSNEVRNQEIGEQTETEPVSATPEKGTSSAQSGGQGYPEVGKWESGVTRGPANQIGVTKWSDIVGSTLKRGKANPLKEGNEFSDMMRGSDLKKVEKDNAFYKGLMNSHNFLQVGAFVTEFLPIVGPFFSAGLIARDSQLYWQEGKQDEAATSMVWNIIPGLQIAKKLGLFKILPANKFKELGLKILKGSKNFNTSESTVLSKMTEYKTQIHSELIKYLDMSLSQSKRKVISNIANKKVVKGAGGAAATYLGTDYLADKAGKIFKK